MIPRVSVGFDQVFSPVSHTAGLPLYRQVVHQVEDAIRRGAVKRGDFLPTESQLCEGFGVARSTLRRAMGQLEARGVLERTQGRGTQVVGDVQLDYLGQTSVSLFADLRAAQRNPRTEVLELSTLVADEDLSSRSSFAIGASLTRLRRLRRAGEVPIAVMDNYLLPDVAVFESDDLVDESLDAVMRARGILTRTVEYEVTATISDRRLADLLRIPEDRPLLMERRWAYVDHDQFINYSENFYHPELYHFRGLIRPDAETAT